MKGQSQNTKQVGVLQNIWDEKFWWGASGKFSKTGINEPKRGDLPVWQRDGGSLECFDAMVSASAKISLLLSKRCVPFSLWFDQFILA